MTKGLPMKKRFRVEKDGWGGLMVVYSKIAHPCAIFYGKDRENYARSHAKMLNELKEEDKP